MTWPKLTAAEIAAFVGAAAWLPQIGQWIYGWLAKPALRITSGATAELGYTNNFGAIANMTLAISASRKDAIIEKMTIEVRHERGDTHVFTWVALDENFSEIRNPSGEKLEVSKHQPAVALKVSTLGLTEKKVLFQDLELQARHRELGGKVGALFEHLVATKQAKVGETVANSKELAESCSHFRDNMYWKEGKYTFSVRAFEIRSKDPHEEAFDVFVTKANIDSLKRNADFFEQDTKELYRSYDALDEKTGKAGAEAEPQRQEQPKLFQGWQWAYPEVRRSTKK